MQVASHLTGLHARLGLMAQDQGINLNRLDAAPRKVCRAI
jgi:hypothetical protein